MCLQTDSNIPKIANEDITCYKVLRITKEGQLTSYYHPTMKWEIGKEYEEPDSVDCKYLEVNGGVFHSYKKLLDAQWENMMSVVYNYDDRVGVFMCIIPKGTRYYEGWTLDEEASYASKRLKVVGEIKI